MNLYKSYLQSIMGLQVLVHSQFHTEPFLGLINLLDVHDKLQLLCYSFCLAADF